MAESALPSSISPDNGKISQVDTFRASAPGKLESSFYGSNLRAELSRQRTDRLRKRFEIWHKQLQQETDNKEKVINELTINLSRAETRLRELQAEHARLQREMDETVTALKASIEENSALEDQFKKLSLQIKEKDERLNTLRRSCADLRHTIAETESDLRRMNEEIQTAKDDTSNRLQQQRAELRQEWEKRLREKEVDRRKLQQELAEKQGSKETLVEELRKRAEFLLLRLKESEAAVYRLQGEAESKMREVVEIDRQLGEQQNQIEALQRQMQVLDNETKRLESRVQERRSEEDSRWEATRREEAKLTSELESVREEDQQLELLQLFPLENELRELAQRTREEEEALQRAAARVSELHLRQLEVERATASRIAKDDAHASPSQLGKLEAANDKLEALLAEQAKTLSCLREKFSEGKVREVEEALHRQRSMLAQGAKEAESCKDKTKLLEDRLHKRKEELALLRTRKAKYAKMLTAAHINVERLSREGWKLKTGLGALESTLESFEDVLEASESDTKLALQEQEQRLQVAKSKVHNQ